MRKFFKTVAIVTVFSTSEKFLGFLYRIFLSRTVGAEGIGLYQVALSVFALLFTICCSGTPITVSRLMTKYKAENRPDRVAKVITAGILVTLAFAIPITLIFYIFAPQFGFLFADQRCIPVFRVVIPGLIFTSVYAVLRGVFWGNKDFLPYSIIELLEEVCMIIVGII
ncbi:MAG: oligosaccharide flippase family protein [Clostridia bacterium]|nr:oligosaccharide flippase family protein [Clostridia bacterium]